VYALPLSSIIESKAIVREAGAALFSPGVGVALAAMVVISTFGALSSAILATARLAYAMARDGALFPALAYVHPRYQTPVASLIALAGWTAAIALSGTFGQLLTFSIFMMILGYIASVGALFVLRRKLPDHPRPYRCIGYPFVPALYLLVAGAWVINTLVSLPRESLSGLVIAAIGVPFYLYWTRARRRSA